MDGNGIVVVGLEIIVLLLRMSLLLALRRPTRLRPDTASLGLDPTKETKQASKIS